MYFVTENTLFLYTGPLLAAFLLFRLFPWVPYHVDFAVFTKDGERGKDVSITAAIVAVTGVIGPILAGYIIQNSGYQTLFLVAIALLLAAAVSYMSVIPPELQLTVIQSHRTAV